MNIEDLRKQARSLSDEELQKRLQEVRSNRRLKPSKPRKTKTSFTPTNKDGVVVEMSEDDLKELFD